MKPKSKSLLLTCVLWLGVGLCAFALAVRWQESKLLLAKMGFAGMAAAVLLLALSYLLSTAVWRQIVCAYTGTWVSWVDALRQLGNLLVGKYIPGGVWGFLMRHADTVNPGRGTMATATAGGVEQLLGLLSTGLAAAVLYLSGWYREAAGLFLILLVPPVLLLFVRALASGGAGLAYRVSGIAQRVLVGIAPVRPRVMRPAVATICLQALVVAGVAWVTAYVGTDLTPMAAVGVAGAYGLAITCGMIALFAPGGILVREAAFVLLAEPWVGTGDAIVIAGILRMLFIFLDIAAGLLSATVLTRRT